jgi:hypothetical protein
VLESLQKYPCQVDLDRLLKQRIARQVDMGLKTPFKRHAHLTFRYAYFVCLPAHLWLGACDGPQVVGSACDLLPGDVVLSELMANPIDDTTYDSNAEWFEIFNTTGSELVLNRMDIVRSSIRADGSVDSDIHHIRGAQPLQARSYRVFGNGNPASQPIDYSYDPDYHPLGLDDSLGSFTNITDTFVAAKLELRCQDRVIDTLTYGTGGIPTPTEGSSLLLDGAIPPDAIVNDDAKRWCSGGDTYDLAGNIGSPGQPNLACGLVRCEQAGVFRDTQVASAGDLVISEVFLDPSGSADSKRYWVELYVASSQGVDLNGLTFKAEGGEDEAKVAQIDSTACISVQPSTYIVVGADADPTLNGALITKAVAAGLSFATSFKDVGGTLTLTRYDLDSQSDLVIDAAQIPPRQSDKSGRSPNDCLNGEDNSIYATQEECEQKRDKDTGLLDPEKESGCTWNSTLGACGGGVKKYSGRSLALDGPAVTLNEASLLNDYNVAFCYSLDAATTAFDGIGTPGNANHSCGTVACEDDGIIRAVVFPTLGDLLVSEVFSEASGSDSNKEWLEVKIINRPVDLNGLTLQNTKSTSTTAPRKAQGSSTTCVRGESGDHLVVSVYNENDHLDGLVQDNGEVTPDLIATTSLTTGFFYDVDSTDVGAPTLQVSILWADQLIDAAEMYGPDTGVTMALAPQFNHSSENDNPDAFCPQETGGLFDGLGTPSYSNVCGVGCFENGSPIAPSNPSVGELIITEIFPNPAGADDHGDWLEVYLHGSQPVQLNGLTVVNQTQAGSVRSWLMESADGSCVTLNPGKYAVIGGSKTADFGVSADALLKGSSETSLLYATNSAVEIHNQTGLIDDAPAYATSMSGKSWSLDPSGLAGNDPSATNDQSSLWCKKSTPSAGGVNEACP